MPPWVTCRDPALSVQAAASQAPPPSSEKYVLKQTKVVPVDEEGVPASTSSAPRVSFSSTTSVEADVMPESPSSEDMMWLRAAASLVQSQNILHEHGAVYCGPVDVSRVNTVLQV